MNRLKSKIKNNTRKSHRVRSLVTGTADKPRLSVFVSNRNISAQLIDDEKSISIAGVSSSSTKKSGTMIETAEIVGQEIAKKAKAKKIKKVAFDRGPKLYHGRVKALAEAARKGGLEF